MVLATELEAQNNIKSSQKDQVKTLQLIAQTNKSNASIDEKIVKLKSRADHPDSQSDFDYLDNILPSDLDYEVIMDIEDDNKMMSDSFIVISAPSTLAFKSIQKGIPTVLLNGYGQIGNFYDFKGVVDLNTQKIFDEIERQLKDGKDIDLRNTQVGYEGEVVEARQNWLQKKKPQKKL